MKTVRRCVYPTMVCFIVLLALGCAIRTSSRQTDVSTLLGGMWQGTVTPEGEDAAVVELNLQVESSKTITTITGTFKIVGGSEGAPVGKSWEIASPEIEGGKFKFIVPILVDEDKYPLAFELAVLENQLFGYARVMEEDGEILAATFKRLAQ